MSIDRRIVSILHFNNISDVNSVEKFLGTNEENYYEVIINGKVEKLKIPDVKYSEVVQEEVKLDVIKPIKTTKKVIEKLDSFTNNLEDVVETIKKSESELFTTTIVTEIKEIPIEEDFFEEELKKTEVENNEILETIKKVKPKTVSKKAKSPKLSDKKIVESKEKMDDDIDDFINTI